MIRFYQCARTCLFVLLVAAGFGATAQTTVSGKVTFAEDGTAIPGANILEKGTSNGTVSDTNGNFTISVGENATLVFSFVGYTTQEVAVNGQTSINVSLQSDVTSLNEVVVIGYGTVQKKDLTGAVGQVSAKDFNPGVNVNPLTSIQGKVAGLTITVPSGDPNESPSVRIRGYTSLLGGSDPLYVVDGVIGVPISSISPNDIEHIDVLKDASATAIYGSRGANGVIIITTKRGQSGKTSVSFDNYLSVSTISKTFDLLDANQYRAQVSRIKGDASFSDGLRFPVDGSGNPYNTDWMKEITHSAYTDDHELSLMGGTDEFNYRGSIDYINQQGIIHNTGLQKVTGRLNLDQKAINDKLNIQYNLSFENKDSKLSNDDVIARAITFLPTLPVRDLNGDYYEVGGSFDLFNPIAMQDNFHNDETNKVFVGSVNMKYEVLPGLTLGANGAFRNENTINSQAYNKEIKAYTSNLGLTRKNLYQTNNKLLDLTAQYAKDFGSNSNFTFLGGYSYQDNIDDGFGAQNNDYVDGVYQLIGYNNLGLGRGTLLSGSTSYTSSYKSEWTLISFFGRGNLNLDNKYNLTATVRRDGSSKFGANNKWGLFPSVAAGWTISNESFMSGASTLSMLKLRVGWGQTGNSEGIDPYKSLPLTGPKGSPYYDGAIGDFVPSYGAIQNYNPDLKWEVLQQTNVGLDFELFEGKIQGTVEVYDKRTKDMLFNFTVPAGTQYQYDHITANVGEMSNKGIELSLGASVLKTNALSWHTSVVGSTYKNEIVSLHSGNFGVGVIRYNPFGGRGLSNVYASEIREGHPLGEFLIPQFAGFDPSTGSVLLVKEGGGTTTDYTEAHLFEKGDGLPRKTLSWINNFQVGKFDVSFQLRGVFGNKIMNNLRSNLAIPGSILETNMLAEVADYPINYSTNQLSDLWLESGSFVRMDNWQIGYNFPRTGKVLSSARIYLAGNNLFIITKYKGLDPELQVKGDLPTSDDPFTQTPNDIGMDKTNIYPKTRTFQLGVNLTF